MHISFDHVNNILLTLHVLLTLLCIYINKYFSLSVGNRLYNLTYIERLEKCVN